MKYVLLVGVVLMAAFLICCRLGRKSDPDWYDNEGYVK